MSVNKKMFFKKLRDDEAKFEGKDISSSDLKLHADYDAEIDIINQSIRKLRTNIVQDNLDPENLNVARFLTLNEVNHGPGDKTKYAVKNREKTTNIASLEGYGELKENTDYAQLFKSVIGKAKTEEEQIKAVNESLINYFALLDANQSSKIDLHFVESLTNVADLCTRDTHGQSIMHEIAREWSTDVAKLLQLKGMNIDLEDNWGRTPLFVAVASNHVKMIKWLIENGADMNHKSIEGQGQAPIHFAAKHNSVEAFELLVKHGADPLMRDDQNRTPFFIAAHAGHQRMCQHMLDMDLPTVSYSTIGEATIDHILDRLPHSMAIQALNQFLANSTVARKMKVYLSCLGKRRWKLLSQNNYAPIACKTEPPGPVEKILARGNVDLIVHPAILYYIKTKNHFFAAKYNRLDIFLHFLFTLLWTLSVSVFKEDEAWFSASGVVVLTGLSQLLTFLFIFKFYYLQKNEYKATEDENRRVMKECFLERKFCHPRWRTDFLSLERNIEAAYTISYSLFDDGWNIVEIVCLTMATIQSILTIIYIGICGDSCVSLKENSWISSENLRNARNYWSAAFILVTWVRLNVCLRHHTKFGPFISMLAGCGGKFIQIAFLFFEFFVPFCVAGWVLFSNDDTVTEYTQFQDLIYQVYLLTIVGDYEYDPLAKSKKLAAQIFIGVYALLVSIITINLYIALLSESFSAISATSVAKAYLQQATNIRRIEMFFPEEKLKFEIYVNRYCAPMIVDVRSGTTEIAASARTIIKDSLISVGTISESMKQINAEQEQIKSDASLIDEKLCKFQSRYNKERNDGLLDEFDYIRRNEERFFVRLSKETDQRITRFMKKFKDIPTIEM